MAVIPCPECGKTVSESAPSCPHCGYAVAYAQENRAAGANMVTTQETSKKFKLQTIISIVLMVWGLAGIFTPSPADSSPSMIYPLMLTAGFVWYVVNRFRIWWYHK